MKASLLPAVFALILCVTAIVPSAWADPVSIPLFNTGVGTGGNLVPDGDVDPHYSLLSPNPDSLGPNAYTLSDSDAYPFFAWLANTSISKWITPHPDYAIDEPGNYVYRTTFYLPPSFKEKHDTASITGLWSSDNAGLDILINGLSTGNTVPYGNPCDQAGYSYYYLCPFSITFGFESGLNTLDFVVNNEGDITGLHVQMTGFYDLKPIPEPSTLGLVCIGILGLIGSGWRRGRRGYRDSLPQATPDSS
jgi:hypothetical protein